MSDIEQIQERIVEIRTRLNNDVAEMMRLQARIDRDHAKLREAQQSMRVVSKPKGRRVRQPDDGSEVEL